MKRFFLRMGALGIIGGLGWIAIAHAQRQDDAASGPSALPAFTSAPGGSMAPVLADPPTAAVPAAEGRATGHQSNFPPRVAPVPDPPSPTPAAIGDPFGLRDAPAPTESGAVAASPPTLGASGAKDEAPLGPEPPAVYPDGTVEISEEPGPGDMDSSAPPRVRDDGLTAKLDRAPPAPAPLQEPPPLETGVPELSAPLPASSAARLTPTERQPILAAPGPALAAPSAGAARLAPFEEDRPADVSATAQGTGRPAADKQFEGVQSPQLNVQKFAPAEVQVGKPAEFRVTVKNFGQTPALGVEVRDEIPRGTRLIDATPPASRGARGELVWQLGKLDPTKEATVVMRVMPLVEGEIGSVATVSFQADASARTFATRPQLVVEIESPRQVMIDEQAVLKITISNPGSGAATGVVIEEHVPPGFQHPAGAELEYEVGTLAPNESRTLELELTAVRPGPGANVIVARGEAVPPVRKELPIDVVAPELKITVDGPTSRFLKRPATYRVAVSNPGTAPAREVRLEAVLPAGFEFVEANNNGHFDPQTRTVQWALAELPANETGVVELTALPIEIGQHTLSLRGSAQKSLAVEERQQTLVDGIAAIRFEVVDVQDPIEVGSETTYEIRVLNQGSKEATNVAVSIEVPAGLQPVAAEGPDGVDHALEGSRIVFAPLPRLSPKVDTTYRIRVQGRQAGDQRVRVLLQTSQMQTPVVKEESTRVFSDR